MPDSSSRPLLVAAPAALQDWHTFAARAQHADSEAAVRMSVTGDVLVLTAAPLHPAGLGDAMPLVLGMRMLRLSDSSHDGLDTVVQARALLDRFVRLEGALEGSDARGAGLSVPPVEVSVPWAGIAPPRGPWAPVGSLSGATLRAAAEAGIAEVAEGTPEGSGAHAVDALRRRVWSRTAAAVSPSGGGGPGREVPSGAAFGAYAMGFLGPEAEGRQPNAQVLSSGPWTRLTLPGGHILSRASTSLSG